jgi:Icc-related predicted phosphoesterase
MSPYQKPIPPQRPNTPLHSDDIINRQRQVKHNGFLPQRVPKGRNLHVVDKKGIAVAPPMKLKEVEDKLWERYGGTELLWDSFESIGIKTDIGLEIGKVAVDAYKQIPESKNNSKLVKEICNDIAINFIPGLRTGLAATRVTLELAKIVAGLLDRKVVDEYRSDNIRRSEMQRIALEGLEAILRKELKKSSIMIGTYSYDLVTSVVDFTGLSSLPSAAIRAVKKTYDLYSSKKMVEEVNIALSKRENFSIAIFTKVPIMACTMMHDIEEAELMGLFDALPTQDLTKEDQESIISRLSTRDQRWINKYKEEIRELKWIAQAHVEKAPFGLTKELKRRKVGKVSKERVTDRVTVRLPGIINPHKPPKKKNTHSIKAHFGQDWEKLNIASIAKEKKRLVKAARAEKERAARKKPKADQTPKPPKGNKPIGQTGSRGNRPKAFTGTPTKD